MNQQQSEKNSSGVEELIERLREQGVGAGQQQAEKIISDAEKQAAWLVTEAKQAAAELLSDTEKEINARRSASEDALKLATRDALLKLRDSLLSSFGEQVQRVVGEKMAQEAFLERLILQLAGKIGEQLELESKQALTLFLPNSPVGVDDLKNNPEALKAGTLTHFTAAIAAEMLRDGVNIQIDNDMSGGLSVRLADEGMVVDFTEETISALLLEHLQPRFRTLLQGIVK